LYSLTGNAILGSALIDAETSMPDDEVVVIGHSMGAITASEVAVRQCSRRPVALVLVSPAFLLKAGADLEPPAHPKPRRGLSLGNVLSLRLLRAIVRAFLQAPGVVYSRGFWEKGLDGAAYKRKQLGEERFAAQVLRYRWPSLFRGWSEGLANFVVARLADGASEDVGALQRLVSAKGSGNLRVLIVTGSEDKVIPASLTKRLQSMLECEMVVLEGVGHVAHEEEPAKFSEVVAKFVRGKGVAIA